MATRQWGVTAPISTTLPTESEIAANNALLEELKRQNTFESKEESDRRVTVLHSLQKITEEFVYQVSRQQGLPESIARSAGGKIFTYGSYRLGVYGPGSDIDTLVVVPKHVTREEFFEHFPPLLVERAPPNAIEELTPVPAAFVPIIKFKYSGISIDLIVARLSVSQVPKDLILKDNNLLRGVEETCLRCLNGTRVTDEILELVPEQKVFRLALRAIKLWAQRRAIYANIMGFPGGVAWAMLVARICQLYPHATSAVILAKFFPILGKWKWPTPVLLKSIEDGPLNVRVWNPKIYKGDQYHLMPIITPAYPSMCATHNITLSTKQIISNEMARAGEIVESIMVGRSQWKELFGKHTFFINGYKYYLSIVAASRSREAQLIWSGLVESKVRLLVASLEYVEAIQLAHPFNKGFDRVHHCSNEDEVEKVINGDLQFQIQEGKTEKVDLVSNPKHQAAAIGDGQALGFMNGTTNASAQAEVTANEKTNGKPDECVNGKADGSVAEKVDDKSDAKIEENTIYTTTYYIGIELKQDGTKQLDVSYQTREFKDTCTAWPQYDPDMNTINVVHTRNYDLPPDVFEPGETRPVRAPKKPKARSKKRGLASVDPEGSPESSVKRRISPNGLNGAQTGL